MFHIYALKIVSLVIAGLENSFFFFSLRCYFLSDARKPQTCVELVPFLDRKLTKIKKTQNLCSSVKSTYTGGEEDSL